MSLKLSAALALLMMTLSGCATMNTAAPPLRLVTHVDLDRYMGRWYVISNIPNIFENGKVGTSDNYARRPDGKLDNIFVFRKGTFDAPEKRWEGIAWVTDMASNAEWKVRLFWPFTSGYQIIELDPDYKWAVVASRGGKLLWVLARETSLSDAVYQDIIGRISRQGLDPAKLVKVPQPPNPTE